MTTTKPKEASEKDEVVKCLRKLRVKFSERNCQKHAKKGQPKVLEMLRQKGVKMSNRRLSELMIGAMFALV